MKSSYRNKARWNCGARLLTFTLHCKTKSPLSVHKLPHGLYTLPSPRVTSDWPELLSSSCPCSAHPPPTSRVTSDWPELVLELLSSSPNGSTRGTSLGIVTVFRYSRTSSLSTNQNTENWIMMLIWRFMRYNYENVKVLPTCIDVSNTCKLIFGTFCQ